MFWKTWRAEGVTLGANRLGPRTEGDEKLGELKEREVVGYQQISFSRSINRFIGLQLGHSQIYCDFQVSIFSLLVAACSSYRGGMYRGGCLLPRLAAR